MSGLLSVGHICLLFQAKLNNNLENNCTLKHVQQNAFFLFLFQGVLVFLEATCIITKVFVYQLMHPSSLFQVQFYLQLLIQMYNIKSIFVVTKLTAHYNTKRSVS